MDVLFPIFASSLLPVFDLAVIFFFKVAAARSAKSPWGWQPVGDKYMHSATRRAWWQTTQFCPKLRPPGYEHIIAFGNYVRCLVLKLPCAKDCSGKPTGFA
jgi:hypothetical protein